MSTSVRPAKPSPIKHSMDAPNDHIEYKTVSKAAVVCIVFGILSVLAFVFPAFVLLPVLSIAFGMVAMVGFKRFPNELIGKSATKVTMIASAGLFVSSLAMHSYIYATEVPEGYQRISFYDLSPSKRTKTPYSDKALTFDGKKVFLKGYVRPGLKKNRLKKFIMVGDFGSCCFGGSPDIADVVAVSIMNEDEYVNYGYRLRRIGGDFKLHQRAKSVREKDLDYVLYEIEADHVN